MPIPDDTPGYIPEHTEPSEPVSRVRRVALKQDLEHKLRMFERIVNSVREGYNDQPMPVVGYRLDYANGGVRIETEDQARTVSPRLTKRGLINWMDAGLSALGEVTRS